MAAQERDHRLSERVRRRRQVQMAGAGAYLGAVVVGGIARSTSRVGNAGYAVGGAITQLGAWQAPGTVSMMALFNAQDGIVGGHAIDTRWAWAGLGTQAFGTILHLGFNAASSTGAPQGTRRALDGWATMAQLSGIGLAAVSELLLESSMRSSRSLARRPPSGGIRWSPTFGSGGTVGVGARW